MRKKFNVLLAGCILLLSMISLAGCGEGQGSAVVESNNASLNADIIESSEKEEENAVSETTETEKTKSSDSEIKKVEEENLSDSEVTSPDVPIVSTDLKPSEGLEFESNGDGTCTIISIGVCTDKDIVIPEKSPAGDVVTLIDEYAFYDIEDVDSITLINCNYEIDKNAFQYGEFTSLNIIGGSPVFNESAFSSCEDLTSISFSDCNIQVDEYAFYSCGKDASLTFSNCTGYIDERAFQYGDFISLTMGNCNLEIDKSAFSSCEALTSIVFTDSTIEADEYAFYGCGDSANVEMTNCSVVFDERVFQYSSLDSITISGSKIEMGDSTFSSCDDLSNVSIDCESVTMGEYAFYGCEDLINVSICENIGSDCNIEIDDRAFQYCDKLESVIFGDGSIVIGEYVFSGCADNLTISVAGTAYDARMIEKGLSK